MNRGVLALAGLALIAGCGGSGDADKDEEAVREAAEEQVDAFASGDYGAAWDMWVDDAKDVMTRDDYIEAAETCELGGIPLEVDNVRLEGDDEAVVRIGLGEFQQAYTMRYQSGEWRWQPKDEALAAYALGADGAVERWREDGSCNTE